MPSQSHCIRGKVKDLLRHPWEYTALVPMLRPILGKFLDFRLTLTEMVYLLADRTSYFRG